MHNFVIPKANNAIAASDQKRCASGVLLPILGVLLAIQLDNQSRLNAAEIRYKRAYRMLATKLESALAAAQLPPQDLLNLGRVYT